MRKIPLTIIGFYLGILGAFSQTDSSAYKQRKLQLDEIDFVTGYYHQNGDHSAVTGGIGTEKLTDLANTIELKFSKYDSRLRKNSLAFELGVDHYTSASSDKIDPSTISSASSADTRIYPSLSWNRQNEQKRTTIGATASFSNEYDYTSGGLGLNFAKASKNNNRELSARAQVYIDRWRVILPIELRSRGGNGDEYEGASEPRNSYSMGLTFSQVVNKNLQIQLIVEPTYQNGLLATKYQRVYFTDNTVHTEALPDTRFKLPAGIRANYFIGDKFIVRSFYRYYQDDWGLNAHTMEVELPVKVSSFFSVSPFYRYYTQNEADYFAPFKVHRPGDVFYTSDYDLSKFNSQFYGMGLRIVPPKGVLGLQHWNSFELRLGHYTRSNNLSSNEVSLHIKLK
jgi:hypothetical protein